MLPKFCPPTPVMINPYHQRNSCQNGPSTFTKHDDQPRTGGDCAMIFPSVTDIEDSDVQIILPEMQIPQERNGLPSDASRRVT